MLYVGDYDPAGVLIDGALIAELRTHSAHPVDIVRLGINENQIEEHGLPTKPRKQSDLRRLDIQETVEAEAMDPNTLRAILDTAIDERLDTTLLQAAYDEEDVVERFLTDVVDGIDDELAEWRENNA